MPGPFKPSRATIKFIVSDSGRLQEIYLVIGSGDPNIDKAVLSAAARALFPKPAAGATLPDRTFVVNYIYN
jgi:TonB family protein